MPKPEIPRRGLMLVISSPSGAGKTTIAHALLQRDPGIAMSVSYTTRPKRPGETDGKDYHFVNLEAFNRMVAEGAFLEHAEVFGHAYGTPKEAVEASLKAGRDLLFDIDWQGNRQLRDAGDGDLVSVFILPPSTEELNRRLHNRAQDSEEVVAARMARAADEISHWEEFDYVVVNDDVAASVEAICSILKAERLRRARRVGLGHFVQGLRES
ncbi:MAG: guanylate kinase [Alphaproteobacteria bacterium]|nr:guanylate kinase [Alphaproteobacteria bacterium]